MALCLIGSIAFTGIYRMRQGGKTERRRLGPYSDNREWKRINLPIYKVATAGGEYKIHSKNYGRLWLTHTNFSVLYPRCWASFTRLSLTSFLRCGVRERIQR